MFNAVIAVVLVILGLVLIVRMFGVLLKEEDENKVRGKAILYSLSGALCIVAGGLIWEPSWWLLVVPMGLLLLAVIVSNVLPLFKRRKSPDTPN